MMALVPTSTSNSRVKNANVEQVCDMLQEIRDEFRTLKTFIANQQEQNKISGVNNLSEILARTEHNVKERTDDVLNLLNGATVNTLPFNPSRHRQGQPQYQHGDGLPRGRVPAHPAPISSRQRHNEGMPIISIGAQQHRLIAPGAIARFEHEARIVGNPHNKRNRQLLHDAYGVQLPSLDKQQRTMPSRNLLSGKTTEPLTILPLKSRRNPIDYPVPLTSEDAKRGIISLVERGIIPQGAHITLEPPPIQPTRSNLNDPSSRTKSFAREETTTSSVYHLESSNHQQLALTGPRFPSPPRFDAVSSEISLESNDRDLSLVLRNPNFHDSSLVESRTSSNSRRKKHSLPTKTSGDAILAPNDRPVSTPASGFEYRKSGRLIIQNGSTKDQTDEFLEFRHLHNLAWGNIRTVFRILERLMSEYAVPIAFIDGKRVSELAELIELEHQPSLDELLTAVINRDEVEEMVKRPGRRFFSTGGRERAATAIQAYWRCFRDRRAYVRLQKRKWATGTIALSWLAHVKVSKARAQLKLRRQQQMERFKIKQRDLRERWPSISASRRVIVHIPSLGLSQRIRRNLKDFAIRENYQIGRLCDLEDPNVNIVYVSPVNVNEEIIQYYNKLMNLRSSVEQDGESENSRGRFMIVVPEALHTFPMHNMCLSTLLKYSPKALKRIRNLIRGREAYLVTGVPHMDDVYLSDYLSIPVYGCEPDVSDLYSTKSGSKRLFEKAQVSMPFGEYDIYNQQHFYESLAQLIVEHLDVQRWLFKIDDDFDGLGIAYCDVVSHLPCYKNVWKEATRFGNKWSNRWAQEQSYAKILSELPDVLERHTTYMNKSQFSHWQAYFKLFLAQGGIIEAYPPSDSVTSLTVCLSIEPDGQYSIICSGDQLHAESQFSCWGLSCPQSSIESNELNHHCAQIVEQCKQRHIYGYIDIDFVTFIDAKTDRQQLWAIDLSIGYSEHVSLYRVMRCVTGGHFDASTHSFQVTVKPTKQRTRNGAKEHAPVAMKHRYAVWSARLHHSNLSVLQYSVFFQMCRAHGVGFDTRDNQGTVFTLLECDRHEHLGMVVIGDTLQQTLANFAFNLNAIDQEITTKTMKGRSNFRLAIHDIETILGTTQENTTALATTAAP